MENGSSEWNSASLIVNNWIRNDVFFFKSNRRKRRKKIGRMPFNRFELLCLKHRCTVPYSSINVILTTTNTSATITKNRRKYSETTNFTFYFQSNVIYICSTSTHRIHIKTHICYHGIRLFVSWQIWWQFDVDWKDQIINCPPYVHGCTYIVMLAETDYWLLSLSFDFRVGTEEWRQSGGIEPLCCTLVVVVAVRHVYTLSTESFTIIHCNVRHHECLVVCLLSISIK